LVRWFSILFELFAYYRHGTPELFGGQYYVINALMVPIDLENESREENREQKMPYWVKNLACAAA